MVTGLFFLSLFYSCDFDINKLFKKELKQDKKDNSHTKTTVPNPFASVFSGLKPQDRNVGLLLALNTLAGYRTLFITYQDGIAEVKTDVPYIIYPYHDSLLYITRLVKDSVFPNIFSGWLPEKTIHHWEEIHVLRNKIKMDSLHRNWEAHIRLPLFVLTRENTLIYDSQKVNIDYLINFNMSLSFKGTDNKKRRKVYSASAGTYTLDSTFNLMSLKPHEATFFNESGIEKISIAGIQDFFSPPVAKELKIKINKALYKKSINNEFADTILPKSYPEKLKADTTEIFFSLRREKGIVKLIAFAYALTANQKISPTYKLKVEYDCGPLQQPYISHNLFPLEFDALKTHFKDHKLNDALLSPFQNLLLVLNEKTLTGIDVKTGQKILTYNLPPASSVIMAEWTNTKHFYQWEQILNP